MKSGRPSGVKGADRGLREKVFVHPVYFLGLNSVLCKSVPRLSVTYWKVTELVRRSCPGFNLRKVKEGKFQPSLTAAVLKESDT